MHLCFDMDGVLLDSEVDVSWLNRVPSRTLRRFDLPVTDDSLDRLSPQNIHMFRENAHELDIEPETLWNVRNQLYVQEKTKAIENNEIKPYQDIDALCNLVDRHEISVLSNSPQSVVDVFLSEYGHNDMFTAWIGRGDDLDSIERIKPATHLFTKLQAEIDGIEGNHGFVYVGDSSKEEEFARAVGVDFVPVRREDGINDLHGLVGQLD